jgi:hypothetical protein
MTVFHTSVGREHVLGIHEVMSTIHANLTVKHYEFVVHKLDRTMRL